MFVLLAPGCRSTTPADAAQAQARLGTKAAKAGLYREAYFRFTRAAVLDPTEARYHNNMGVLAEALGDAVLAEAHYARAAALAPRDERIRKNYELLKAYLDSGKPADPAR